MRSPCSVARPSIFWLRRPDASYFEIPNNSGLFFFPFRKSQENGEHIDNAEYMITTSTKFNKNTFYFNTLCKICA